MIRLSKSRLIIGYLVTLLFIAGLWLLVSKYFEILADMNQTVTRNPINQKINQAQQQAVDLAQLEAEYAGASRSLMNEYLIQALVADADLLVLSQDYQAKMLALSLPAKYKESHLAQILLLGEIAELAQEGQTAQALEKVQTLKDFKIE